MSDKTQPFFKQLGPIELNIKNLDLMKSFYHEIIGLDIIEEQNDLVKLGKGKTSMVHLHHTPEFTLPAARSAGLYHVAILYASRKELSKTIYNILQKTPHFFTGSADHLVSEAFYFSDPEGNGIELYFDRDRSSWIWENNMIKMATYYLDPVEYIERNLVLTEIDTSASVGHVHLKVGSIIEAKHFYADILGFTVTAALPGALFVSVGGYHHHIGMNTWESSGANKRPDSLGLRRITFLLEDKAEVQSLILKLKNNNILFTEKNNSIEFRDPWDNRILIETI